MSNQILPLPCYPYPVSPERLEELRAAKAELDFDFQVQLCPAVPGSPGRVLAWTQPPFICEAVPVGSFPSLKEALAAVYAGSDDERIFGALSYLRAVMGNDVREVADAA